MGKIVAEIFRALKDELWLKIIYKNRQGEKTDYWISIQDIEPEKRHFYCAVFNPGFNDSYQENYRIRFEGILWAKTIANSYARTDALLLEKMEKNPHQFDFLDYDSFNQATLDYYIEAYKEDTIPYQENTELIPGIDEEKLSKEAYYDLNNVQFGILIGLINSDIKKTSKKKHALRTLNLNLLSIKTPNGLFSVAHKRIRFDIANRRLILDDAVDFNTEFIYTNRRRYSFRNYFSMDLEAFITTYEKNKKHYHTMISKNLFNKEKLDERPYIFTFEKRPVINLDLQYQGLSALQEKDELPRPIKAFFGNLTRRNLGKKKHDILLFDQNVNIDQLRVVKNALLNPVTYVQGPPGTGKTSTILNTILSAFYNDETLLVTSNNNHPIDGIFRKLRSLYHGKKHIPFPVIRLGNQNVIRETLDELSLLFNSLIDQKTENPPRQILRENRTDHKKLKLLLELYEEKETDKEKLEALKDLNKVLKDRFFALRLQEDIRTLEEKVEKMPTITNERAVKEVQVDKEALYDYLYQTSMRFLNQLNQPSFKTLKSLIVLPENEMHDLSSVEKFNAFISTKEGFAMLLKVFPVVLCTNLSTKRLGPPLPHFDLVIMDEAGQCNPATALIPMLRGHKLLLVGDTNQLKPIVSFPSEIDRKLRKAFDVNEQYSYKDQSILSLMHAVDSISKSILLKYHYRCKQKIINFSNEKFYAGSLVLKTEEGDEDTLNLVNVISEPAEKNVALNEVGNVVHEIEKSQAQTIGVVTPFRAQAQEIKEQIRHFKSKKDVTVGTIHTFQGDEKDHIIFSLAVTENTYDKAFDWIRNNREILNVATTRAKDKLTLICDNKEVRRRSLEGGESSINQLMSYIKQNGNYRISDASTEQYRRAIGRTKTFDSESEQEFFETISHYLSTNQRYIVEKKVKLSDIIEKDRFDKQYLDYYFRAHFDFVVFDVISKRPLLAIEINGDSHITDARQRLNDKKKMEIVRQSKSMYLQIIPNAYVRRYELIKDCIISFLSQR